MKICGIIFLEGVYIMKYKKGDIVDAKIISIEKYGVWQEKKRCGKVSLGVVRTTFIIDENGDKEENAEKIKDFMIAESVNVDKARLTELYEKNMAEYFCKQIDLLK